MNRVAGECIAAKAPPAPTTALGRFAANNSGKGLANAAGTYRGECVSLLSQYLLQVYGIRTEAWGNAFDYRSGGSAGRRLAGVGFTWRTDRTFRNGDILVWGPLDGAPPAWIRSSVPATSATGAGDPRRVIVVRSYH